MSVMKMVYFQIILFLNSDDIQAFQHFFKRITLHMKGQTKSPSLYYSSTLCWLLINAY